MTVAVWDKKPTDMYAICSAAYERHMLEATVLSPSFSLIGVETRKGGAQVFIQSQLHKSAVQHGILDMAVHYSSLTKASLSREKWDEALLVGLRTKTLRGRGPSAFQLLKWKSDEASNDLRFRLVISHARHFLRRFSRLMGRALSLLLKELHIAHPVWGTPSLMGIRDFMVLTKQWYARRTVLAERDIDNAYWELPKDGVLDAVTQAAQRVQKHGGMRGSFHFSIAKGGERLLDRIGSATERHFRVVPLEDLLKFVRWDLYENTLFEWQGWVLNQNIKGVPIGGYLSAQLMCIWALVQEINFVENPGPLFEKLLLGWDRRTLPEISLKPGPTLTFPKVAWVPKDTHTFNRTGMSGWFEPAWKLVGTLFVQGVHIELRAVALWDSHPEGRLGHIIQSAPRKQHFFLRNYFLQVDPIRCIVAETSHTTAVLSTEPAILLTRYMDNTYVAFCNIPREVLGVARLFLVRLQQELYQVPFKWEPEGQFLSWGECNVSCTPTLSLTLKGFRIDFLDPSVWDRWPDRWSPSCPLVLRSMVPALVLKSILFALCRADQSLNVRGVVTGFGYKKYQWTWWYMPLRCRLQALGLPGLCEYGALKQWVADGKAIALSLGRGGGCTHTQESNNNLPLVESDV